VALTTISLTQTLIEQLQFSRKHTFQLTEGTDTHFSLGPMDCNIRGTNILLRQCYIFFYFYFIAWTYNIAMCVLDYDPCNPNPCTHGTCTTSSGSVQCSCHSGYSGATCGKHCWFDPHLYDRWQLRNTYNAHAYTLTHLILCTSFEHVMPFLSCLLGFVWEKDWISPWIQSTFS
jgi:hypothetical protein